MSTTAPRAAGPIAQRTRIAETSGVGWAASARRPLSIVGGAAMIATPLLLVAGMLTSPPQASRSQADYIESLARDPWLSSISASLLHYGWVTMALGLLVAITLLPGRRGRTLTLVGGIGGGFAAVQMSALMLNDYFLSALGNNVPMTDAVTVADAMMVHGDLFLTAWWLCSRLALLLPVLLYLGLARARVIAWWLTPLSLLPMIAPFMVMGLFGTGGDLIGTSPVGLVVGGLVGLVCYAPTFLVGLRLLDRSRPQPA